MPRTLSSVSDIYIYLVVSDLIMGLDLHSLNQDGNTALYNWVIHANLKIGELLIRLGAKVNSKNEFGNTPLHWAMIKGGK